MMKHLASLAMLCLLAVGGCATTANYEKILRSWVGAHVDRLVARWGPPQSSFRLSDGGQVLEYTRQRTVQGGGNTYTQPQTA